MKKLLVIISLFTAFVSDAQNYQCLQSGVKHYFTNGNGYLRGIRIDSIRAVGTDTVYYPFRTIRGTYVRCERFGLYEPILDSNGGCWLGKKVIQQADGTYLFDNLWNDTVVIKTQANVGDTWNFFNDTSKFSYRASVTSVGTMTILGSMDSIKRIAIYADSNEASYPADPVNNFEIILSKNNGFVKVIDLYTFPYHRPDTLNDYRQFFDHYLDVVLGNLGITDLNCFLHGHNKPDSSNSEFNLVSFYNPQTREIYDFAVGDVYEKYFYNIETSGWDSKTTLDTVVAKTTTATSVFYTFSDHSDFAVFDAWGPTTTHYYDSRILNGYGDTNLLINPFKMPEERGVGFSYYYFPDTAATSGPCIGDKYTIAEDVFRFEYDGHWSPPGTDLKSYRIGLGQTAMKREHWVSTYLYQTENYIYVLKNGTACTGSFMPIANKVPNLSAQKYIHIFPNPATIELTISSSDIVNSITITNIIGQTFYSEQYNTKELYLDVAALPQGAYLIKINGTEVRKFEKL